MIHIRWKEVNAYQANQQTSLNPIASPLNPGPGWDSKEIAWKEGIDL